MPFAAPPLPDVLEEHLEEYAFLSLQRKILLIDFETNAAELRAHESRIAAHEAALEIGGEASAKVARQRLEDTVLDWEICAALRTWFRHGDPAREEIAEALDAAEDYDWPGWIEGFRGLPAEEVRRLPNTPAGLVCSVDALGWHGRLDARNARTAATHEHAAVRARAARWLHRVPGANDLEDALLADADENVRRCARWSQALREPAAAVADVRRRIAETDAFDLRVLGLFGDANDLQLLADRAREEAAALRALGDLLDPRALDVLWKFAGLDEPELRDAAGDAIRTLVGEPTLPEDEGGDVDDDEPIDVENDEPEWSWADLERQTEAARAALGDTPRWLRGRPFPSSDPDEVTTEEAWRRGLADADANVRADQRDVPSRFFTAVPTDEAVCGE